MTSEVEYGGCATFVVNPGMGRVATASLSAGHTVQFDYTPEIGAECDTWVKAPETLSSDNSVIVLSRPGTYRFSGLSVSDWVTISDFEFPVTYVRSI